MGQQANMPNNPNINEDYVKELVKQILQQTDLNDVLSKAIESKVKELVKNTAPSRPKISIPTDNLTPDVAKSYLEKAVKVGDVEAIRTLTKHLPQDDPYVRGLFWKSALLGEKDIVKAIGEDTTSGGAYLVPQGFVPHILRKQTQYGLIRKLAKVQKVTYPKGSIPKDADMPPVLWEGETATDEWNGPIAGVVEWTLQKVRAFVSLSIDLIKDSPINVVNYVEDLIARANARNEDIVFLTNSEDTKPLGVIPQVPNENTLDESANTLTYAMLVELVRLIEDQDADFREKAVFVVSPKGMEEVRKLTDANGRPLFVRDPQEGRVGTILGYPVYVSNALTQAETTDADGNTILPILFGDFTKSIIFENGDMGFASTTDGAGAFENDLMIIKFWQRKDFKVAYPEAFALLKVKKS